MCRYFSQYNYCKFGEYCKFKHGEFRSSEIDKEIEKLKLEIDKLGKLINVKERKSRAKILRSENCQQMIQSILRKN